MTYHEGYRIKRVVIADRDLSEYTVYCEDDSYMTTAARLLPDSARQQRRVDNLSCACIYQGTPASYFSAYNAYDDERVAELCRRYSLIEERMSRYGVDITEGAVMIYDRPFAMDKDLEVQAWAMLDTDISPLEPILPTREMPKRVADILAEKEKGLKP